MTKPFFSVVIPTHNRSDLLKRAIKSVIAQTYENFEIIVVDDQSTDDTAKMVNMFSDVRVCYFLNKRTKGACGDRNTGILASEGKWIAFLDDDDFWLPDKLLHQFCLIEKSTNSVGVICTDYAIQKQGEEKLRLRKNRPSGWGYDKVLYGNYVHCLSSTCVRHDILSSVSGFDELLASKQDQDLWLRAARLAEFSSVPEIDVIMQHAKSGRISTNYLTKLDGHTHFRNKHAELINRSLRLRHRYDAYIFIYAMILKKKAYAIKSLPWFLLGIFVDLPKCLQTYRAAVLHWYRSRTQIFNTPWS